MTLRQLSILKPGKTFSYKGSVLTIKWIDVEHTEDSKWIGIALLPNELKIFGFSFGYPDLNLELRDFST